MRRTRLTRLILATFFILSFINTAMAQGGTGRETPKPQPAPRKPAPTNGSAPRHKSLPAKFVNQYRMEFVLVPEGKFMMGSIEGDDFEKPLHGVTIGQAFYIGKYEVTQWQWRAVMAITVDEQRRKQSESTDLPTRRMSGQGDDLPMYYVSWEEAHAFLQRLNALNDGYIYRLPSEAEWEYACRAGATEDRPTDLNAIAWYKTNANDVVHSVGMRRPNSFGVYDMLGNVWEWCEDLQHSNYDGAPADGGPWLTTGDLNERVARGGSFFTANLHYLRCSARGGYAPDYRDFETGFRVVATARVSVALPAVKKNPALTAIQPAKAR